MQNSAKCQKIRLKNLVQKIGLLAGKYAIDDVK